MMKVYAIRVIQTIKKMLRTMHLTAENEVAFVAMFKILRWKTYQSTFYNTNLNRLLKIIKQLDNFKSDNLSDIETELITARNFKILAIKELINLVLDPKGKHMHKTILIQEIIALMFDLDHEVCQVAMYAIQSLYLDNQDFILPNLLLPFAVSNEHHYPLQNAFITTLFDMKSYDVPISQQVTELIPYLSHPDNTHFKGHPILPDSYEKLLDCVLYFAIDNETRKTNFNIVKYLLSII